MYMCIYIYVYVYICMYMYICICGMQGYCVGIVIGYDRNKTTYLIVTTFQLSH